MKKIMIVIKCIVVITTLYLFACLLTPVGTMPMPKFYNTWIDNMVDSQMANDPVIKIGNTTMKIANQRDSIHCLLILHDVKNATKIDSLEHVIDSLKQKHKK